MDYATLKSRVQDAMGRSDVPGYVYELATSDVNRRFRGRDMEATATLSVSSEDTALPSGVLEIKSAYIDRNPRQVLLPTTADGANQRHDSSGLPAYYAIVGDSIRLMPIPDGTYSVEIIYFAKLANLSADSDTNDVMASYPGLYIYGALRHAAVWAQDADAAAMYDEAWGREIRSANEIEARRAVPGPFVSRSGVGGF